jgi:large subunit ribosomal protein L7/L12
MKSEKILNKMADVKNLAEQLVALTVKEVQELADFLKSEYGIEPAAAAVVVSGGGDGAGAAAAEEKTSFNVILKSAGASKLNVVKIVKDLTGLGLKEAKDLVDGAPKPIKEGVDKATADDLAAKLKDAGADVEIV